ncbi:hypothetical protein GE09DRAFT_1110578 [Coniochaeta sp. 2T2.1]|nr:hypothetical protein GE09DRAFT_1110578 [Coniochaeta sp. 2T2.1]
MVLRGSTCTSRRSRPADFSDDRRRAVAPSIALNGCALCGRYAVAVSTHASPKADLIMSKSSGYTVLCGLFRPTAKPPSFKKNPLTYSSSHSASEKRLSWARSEAVLARALVKWSAWWFDSPAISASVTRACKTILTRRHRHRATTGLKCSIVPSAEHHLCRTTQERAEAKPFPGSQSSPRVNRLAIEYVTSPAFTHAIS